MNGDTPAEKYERTMSRLEEITRVAYQVKVQWDCVFQNASIVKQKPELLTHPIVRHSPLCTRDALYGGRTEDKPLHYNVKENETIQYVDVMNLCPYICKYFKFPSGHTVIHVGDACKDIEACLRMDGMIKCSIAPSQGLYHPVLPFRGNKKLMFSSCKSCLLIAARGSGSDRHVGNG